LSRARNAEDFLQEYRRIRFQYDALYRHRIEAIRAAYSDNPGGSVSPSVDNALEAHLREYFVNAFLRALNWRMDVSVEDDLPNLVPEAPIASSLEGTIKFLDYLGTEREGCDPLLIVESKRPSSPLPNRKAAMGRSSFKAMADEPCASIISAGLGGTGLTGEWNKWLDSQRGYVETVYDRRGRAPRRVLLISGRWLIIFVDPADSFLATGSRSPEKILVFTVGDDENGDYDLIERHYGEIFYWLENQRILDEVPPLTVAEVAFHVNPELISRMVHGLHLLYIEEPDFLPRSSVALSVSPVIKVMPIIFIRSQYGAWLRVNSEERIEMPHAAEHLAEHLRGVQEIATRLLQDINTRLETHLTATTIESHFAHTDDFQALRGVVEKPKNHGHYDEHVVVTGHHTHYFRLEPTVAGCPHHDWGNSNRENRAALVSIERRSTNPRAFFISGENHHCAHGDVAAAKSCQITPGNRDRCGPRSGKDYDAFCEIWRFEKHLCCRTCVFEDVCTKAQVFGLPCHRT
jgi:hypothetical protein